MVIYLINLYYLKIHLIFKAIGIVKTIHMPNFKKISHNPIKVYMILTKKITIITFNNKKKIKTT